MKIHYLQHAAFEGLGMIESWAESKRHAISVTRFYNNEPLPGLESLDWLIIMGGPMNIYEEDKFPWLMREKRFIEQAIRAGKTILGICLGAQLIADVLGAKVFRNREKEIGWFPLQWTPAARRTSLFDFMPEQTSALHWHGDTFPLPAGSIRLAGSQACENQGFLYNGRVVGLQFHWEATEESLRALIRNCGDEIVSGSFIQAPEALLSDGRRIERTNKLMARLLNNLAGMEPAVSPAEPSDTVPGVRT